MSCVSCKPLNSVYIRFSPKYTVYLLRNTTLTDEILKMVTIKTVTGQRFTFKVTLKGTLRSLADFEVVSLMF